MLHVTERYYFKNLDVVLSASSFERFSPQR